MRKILHIDMDAFYAAVEQRDDPRLAGEAIAVGGDGKRGVVMTASYEARRFGVRSAMPSAVARRLCPTLRFVRPRFDAYREASEEIRNVFRSYSTLVEPLSLDEAFLDVTEPLKGPPSGTLLAIAIKEEIHRRTKLTASAGVAPNKFLAKVASAMQKPDGLTVVRPEQAGEFIAGLPIERFFGVGPATARKLRGHGIENGADLQALSRAQLSALLGKAGHWFFDVARGVDERKVSSRRGRKSLSAERTFQDDIAGHEEVAMQLSTVAAHVYERMSKSGLSGRTVTIKLRFHDFRTITRSKTMKGGVSDSRTLETVCLGLLEKVDLKEPIRLLGVGVSNLVRNQERIRQTVLPLGKDIS